jgi:hypothetical protein
VPEKGHSGNMTLPRVPGHGTQGTGHLRVLEHGTQRKLFSIFWRTAPSNVVVKCNFSFSCVKDRMATREGGSE